MPQCLPTIRYLAFSQSLNIYYVYVFTTAKGERSGLAQRAFSPLLWWNLINYLQLMNRVDQRTSVVLCADVVPLLPGSFLFALHAGLFGPKHRGRGKAIALRLSYLILIKVQKQQNIFFTFLRLAVWLHEGVMDFFKKDRDIGGIYTIQENQNNYQFFFVPMIVLLLSTNGKHVTIHCFLVLTSLPPLRLLRKLAV